jgi:hypothetical protein
MIINTFFNFTYLLQIPPRGRATLKNMIARCARWARPRHTKEHDRSLRSLGEAAPQFMIDLH